MIRIGTAGWTIPRQVADQFPREGTGLERYATRFTCVEITSSFYRPHRPEIYHKWARLVPAGFRFAVKFPKAITHERRLVDCGALIEPFLQQVTSLGDRLGPLLIQLPPSLDFNAAIAQPFLDDVRSRHAGLLACEPRHPTWFSDEADQLLVRYHVARVAADPARVPLAAAPGGWPDLVYFRLHGSPRMYFSPYEPDFLAGLSEELQASSAAESWCIFDNTASGAAARDALALSDQIGSPPT